LLATTIFVDYNVESISPRETSPHNFVVVAVAR